MEKVILGLSGGVDSSVAAAILKKQGYEVIGITFKFVENFDAEDAIKVAKTLDIEHHVIDYRDIFKEKVINKFLDDYKSGITPNPCVICNKNVKLRFLLDEMYKFNADYIATGHYARYDGKNLLRAIDDNKDQTYFLSQVTKEQLKNVLFPIGDLVKPEVRKIAEEIGLSTAKKKDSTGICFIGERNFKQFLENYLPNIPGDIVNIETNEVMGKHIGLMYYTIGQRKGLDVGGTKDKLFVVGKDLNKNILYVCLNEDNEYLISNSCLVSDVNFNCELRPKKCTAKFRYRQKDNDVTIDYLDNGEIIVRYNNVKSVTPGQACVLYDGDKCIGGGIIKEVRKNDKKLWYLL